MRATASLPLETRPIFAMTSPASEASSLVQDVKAQSLFVRAYGNCVQAFVVGLCLEGVLALCLYGVYHIGHVVR